MSTKIEYADETWNPFAGCSPCSPGCDNCYAARAACGRWLKQHPLYEGLAENNKWTGEVRLCTDIGRSDILDKPLHWKESRTIFVGNMGDLFHEEVPFEFIDKVFGIFGKVGQEQHTYLLLTKRPKQMQEYFVYAQKKWMAYWPYSSIHLGVTVCNQAEFEKKGPIHLQIPGKKWWSFEPLLGPVDTLGLMYKGIRTAWQGVDWVVMGCESGPKRRPCELDWMIDLAEQCKAAGVRVHVKQVNINGKVSHNMAEWPEKLRIREALIKKP